MPKKLKDIIIVRTVGGKHVGVGNTSEIFEAEINDALGKGYELAGTPQVCEEHGEIRVSQVLWLWE